LTSTSTVSPPAPAASSATSPSTPPPPNASPSASPHSPPSSTAPTSATPSHSPPLPPSAPDSCASLVPLPFRGRAMCDPTLLCLTVRIPWVAALPAGCYDLVFHDPC